MSNYPSRWLYYIFVVIILIILSFVVLFVFVPINPDLNYNIFSEIWGIIATVLLLMFVVEYREYKEWESVEKSVKTRLGIQLYGLFTILARFIYPDPFETRPSKKEVIKILENLNEMRGPTLTQYAHENFIPELADETSVFLIESLFEHKQNIIELEMKYSRFLKPNLIYSLMEIQDSLNSIKNYFNLLKTYSESMQLQEIVEKAMPKPILGIMKELYRIHKMGIEIYLEQT